MIRAATISCLFSLLLLACSSKKENKSDETFIYTNPIIHADYSDPDVIAVGDRFYMTASSFNCIPGLPILESKNLVDWKLIGYAIDRLAPDSIFNRAQHGNGVWAPAIRQHNGEFYIYYGDPDLGIFVVKAKDIHGPWTAPILVRKAKGWIDPCPFWDEDGQAYLVRGWAGSRAGVKSELMLHKLSPDGTQITDNGVMIFDGHDADKTVEGPKMYKQDGYYYVFAPAGGVEFGWQLVLRSKNIYGPYEKKVVLHQGDTQINGPHQGAWVKSPLGESWFIHFQDKGAYGRIIHLQPMSWQNGWPMIGIDTNNDSIGEPVLSYKYPVAIKDTGYSLTYSDEFNVHNVDLNWQWHANCETKWGYPSGNLGFLRLNAIHSDTTGNLWDVPNLFLQKFPAAEFTVTTKMTLYFHNPGDKAGLLVMGLDYACLQIQQRGDKNQLQLVTCFDAEKNGTEQIKELAELPCDSIYLQYKQFKNGTGEFAYGFDNKYFTNIDYRFTPKPGRWIGAKTGLFCLGKTLTNDVGYVNVDWYRVNF